MKITFHKCSDYVELIDVHHRITGNPRNQDHYDVLNNFQCFKESFKSYIIKSDERIIGYFTFSIFHLEENPNKYVVEIILSDTDIVDLVLEKLISELKKTSCEEVLFFCCEKTILLKEAVEKLGDIEVMTQVESQFDLYNQEIIKTELTAGYEIKSFKDIKNEMGDASFEFVFQIVKESLSDIPGCSDQAEKLTPTKLKTSWQGQHFIEDASFFILYENKPIAIHNIVSRNEGDVEAGVTGVARHHRRKGLMRALKLRGMKWAKENGYKNFNSSNEKDNPMLTLNYELGFKKIQESYSLILKIPKT